MAGTSAIEWTEATWNPVTGCDRVSPGCAHCYARTMAKRLKAIGNPRYQRDGDGPGFGVTLHPDLLEVPLRWRKPRRVFVNSMSDLFHEEIPDEFVTRVFDVMERASQHTFQVLTKRPENAARWAHEQWCDALPANVWLGVSIESARYTWRADVLRGIPAAVRFVSAEPLLGSLYPTKKSWRCASCGKVSRTGEMESEDDYRHEWKRQELDLTGLDWLIIGGESGPGARPFDVAWARELVAACRAAGVAVFVKQLGARPYEHLRPDLPHLRFACEIRDRKGGDPAEWPADLRVREFPAAAAVPA